MLQKELIFFSLTCLAGVAFSACQPGKCSLDGKSSLRNENCNIKADTECDINANCNGDGKCYFDQYTENITCICSEQRFGDRCQHNYTILGLPCSSNLDCRGGLCIEDGSGDNITSYCVCSLGFKGPRCEQLDRKYLSESWECENKGNAYIQGQHLGCSCKCGTVGQFCEKMDQHAPYHYDCDYWLCERQMGKCVKFIGRWSHRISYGCKCPNGFVGTFCQYPDTTGMPPRKPSRSQCPSGNNIDCRNGGSCFVNNKDGKYACECPCGFHGDLCQFSDTITNENYKDPCKTTDLVCENGGECYYNTSECRAMCKCYGRFIGDLCQRDCGPYRGCANENCGNWFDCVEDECGNPDCVENENYGKDTYNRLSTFGTLGIICAVLVSAVIIAGFVCCMNNRRRRKHRERQYTEQEASAYSALQRSNQNNSNNINCIPISENVIYTVTSNRADAHTRQNIEQLNAHGNVNTTQNSTIPGSNPGQHIVNPPSYEEVCQPPPTYSDVLRSIP